MHVFQESRVLGLRVYYPKGARHRHMWQLREIRGDTHERGTCSIDTAIFGIQDS